MTLARASITIGGVLYYLVRADEIDAFHAQAQLAALPGPRPQRRTSYRRGYMAAVMRDRRRAA